MVTCVCLQAAAKAKKVVDKEKKAREGLKKLEVSFSDVSSCCTCGSVAWPMTGQLQACNLDNLPAVKARVSPFEGTLTCKLLWQKRFLWPHQCIGHLYPP